MADTNHKHGWHAPGHMGRGVPEQADPRFLEHAMTPLNLGFLPRADGKATGVGTCGDSIEIAIQVKNERIMEVRVMPNGCMHTVACASALSQMVKGAGLAQALEVSPSDLDEALGGLPEDHQHCARLAVNTFGEAVEDYYRRERLAPRR